MMLLDQPYIRLEMDGPVGRLNRAQRAIDNTRETFPAVLVTGLLAGFVFPKPTCVLAVCPRNSSQFDTI